MFANLQTLPLSTFSVIAMDTVLRRLRIQELKARILLYEREHSALLRELRSAKLSVQRRVEIYSRHPRLSAEYTEAVNDLNWLTAEERLCRPDRAFHTSVQH